MEAADVREVLLHEYGSSHSETFSVLDKICDSQKCAQISNLSASQVHRLGLRSKLRSFESGETIFSEGLDNIVARDNRWNLLVRNPSTTQHAYIAAWSQDTIRSIFQKDEVRDKLRILKSVFLFKALPHARVLDLAQSMVTTTAQEGDVLARQGDIGDSFCIVGLGRVNIERNGRCIRSLSKGDYFGERALLTNEHRSATVKASEACVLWEISQDAFLELTPPALMDYLRQRSMLLEADYNLSDLTFLDVIGIGGFAIVKMVQSKSGDRFALKCVQKRPITQLNRQQALVSERSILEEVDHPFIMRMVKTFRNEAYVYLLFELVTGGELLDTLSLLGVLNQYQSQFYAGSIVLALEHLHGKRIAYLDLKSENILVDAQGYIKLVDLGSASKIHGSHLYEVKGTPHFMSPEMILGRGYTTMADFWALGICMYEFLVGELPFGSGRIDKSEIFKSILKSPLTFPTEFTKKRHAQVSMDIMRALLQPDPNKRLGGSVDGIDTIKKHRFFADLDWEGLIVRSVDPPYVPDAEIFADVSHGIPKGSVGTKGQNMAIVEAKAEQQELARNWTDPEPGWDDDFG